MSTFLTLPIWYNSAGVKSESLCGVEYPANAISNTAFGKNSSAGTIGSKIDSAVAIGAQAKASGNKAISIGGEDVDTKRFTQANGTGSIAIGSGAQVEEVGGVAIGAGSFARANSVAIGDGASANAANSIAIGNAAFANSANLIQLGNLNTKYDLKIGNGQFSLIKGSTAQNSGNWISIKSSGISEGLYFVRYGAGTHMSLVYLMAPIEYTAPMTDNPYTNDWYFPYSTGHFNVDINDTRVPVDKSYYLKVDKTSTSTDLKITAGEYRLDSSGLSISSKFMKDLDAEANTFLFKVL